MRPASPGRGFSTATTAMSGQKQTLTAASAHCHEQRFAVNFWEGGLFDWALLVSPTAQCTDLPGFSGGKATTNAGENPFGTQGETHGSSTMGPRLTLHVRSRNITPPLKTIAGMDGAGLWLGLPGHRTPHQWTSPYEATLKP